MNLDTVLLVLALWVVASVPVSLVMAGRMRSVDAREARTHRAPGGLLANRVARPPREFRHPRETRDLRAPRVAYGSQRRRTVA